MDKTTVYLTPALRRALKRMARHRGCSEAQLIREALARLSGEADAPPPRLPLFSSGAPSIADDIDAALERFGRE